MNRTIFMVAGVFGASSLLLVDSAVKGSVLLMLAAVAALILRRDSAATRHLVWLLAIVAMLVVPMLSALLPQWRVLPKWAGISPEPVVVDTSPPSIARLADRVVELPQNAAPVEVEPREHHAERATRIELAFSGWEAGSGGCGRTSANNMRRSDARCDCWRTRANGDDRGMHAGSNACS